MPYQHELLLTTEAMLYFSRDFMTAEDVIENMRSIADKICELKGWTVGLNCMLVLRDGQGGRKPYFVINQVLDTQTKVRSVEDLNKNTPSLNSDPHCILTTKENGPNRYGGYARLLATVSSDFTCKNNGKTFKRIV
jgi:hypothetical protein